MDSSSDDGHKAANVLNDETPYGNSESRWSGKGIGEHITLKLDKTSKLHKIFIRFHKGDERESYFDVQISNNGVTFESILENQTAGLATEIDMPRDKNARWVRIVGKGNSSQNGKEWNSIEYIKLLGTAIANCPPGQERHPLTGECKEPPICGQGKKLNPLTWECVEKAPFIAENGVLQIYENNARIPIWVMGLGNWKERRLRGGHHDGEDFGEGVNTISRDKNQVRYNVLCKPGAGEGREEDNQKKLDRGWSDSPDDFVNIEQTGYIDVVELTETEKWQPVTWYGPSGRHTGDMKCDETSDKRGCWGSSYKGSLHPVNGKNRMAKENFHNCYSYGDWNWENIHGDVQDVVKQMYKQNKRVGFKWVNCKVGNKRRLEIWVDVGGAIGYNEQPKNEWQLIRVQEDDSNFGKLMDKCGCDNQQQAILWGGPYVTYRWDGEGGRNKVTIAQLSLATVQEINPPTTFHNAGDKVTRD